MNPIRHVCIVGLGYIGLPTAAVLAMRGLQVTGVDVKRDAVDTINAGRIHFIEPELGGFVSAAVNSGNLKATTEPVEADAFVIAVPTPLTSDRTPDMTHVFAATESVGKRLKQGNIVVLESTSPVGTTAAIAGYLANMRSDLSFPRHSDSPDVAVAYSPERVLPGNTIQELIQNDRIIGGLTDNCAQRAKEIYQTFVSGECLLTTAETAELSKLAENSFRDLNIAFANELSMISDQYGVDPWRLVQLANRHPRVNILQPGCGVGGHCIAVDPWFLISEHSDIALLMRMARDRNSTKTEWVVEKIAASLEEAGSITLLGLSFKPDIDDLRESPAIDIALSLAGRGFKVSCVEPSIEELPDSLSSMGRISLIGLDESLAIDEPLAALVRHSEFIARRDELEGRAVLDFCGLWS